MIIGCWKIVEWSGLALKQKLQPWFSFLALDPAAGLALR